MWFCLWSLATLDTSPPCQIFKILSAFTTLLLLCGLNKPMHLTVSHNLQSTGQLQGLYSFPFLCPWQNFVCIAVITAFRKLFLRTECLSSISQHQGCQLLESRGLNLLCPLNVNKYRATDVIVNK